VLNGIKDQQSPEKKSGAGGISLCTKLFFGKRQSKQKNFQPNNGQKELANEKGKMVLG